MLVIVKRRRKTHPLFRSVLHRFFSGAVAHRPTVWSLFFHNTVYFHPFAKNLQICCESSSVTRLTCARMWTEWEHDGVVRRHCINIAEFSSELFFPRRQIYRVQKIMQHKKRRLKWIAWVYQFSLFCLARRALATWLCCSSQLHRIKCSCSVNWRKK